VGLKIIRSVEKMHLTLILPSANIMQGSGLTGLTYPTIFPKVTKRKLNF
jgi:hypothetical protein